MKIKKSLLINITEYFLLFLIILECYTVYSITDKDLFLSETITVVAGFLLLENINWVRYKDFNRWLAFVIPYIILLTIFVIASVSFDFFFGFCARFFVFIPSMIMIFIIYFKKNKIYSFFCKYVNIMIIIAIMSLFFWVLGSQLHLLTPSSRVFGHWGTNGYDYPSYFGLYFERQRSNVLFFNNVLRNQGIFAEAPMYSLNLCIAIAIELFLKQNQSNTVQSRRKRYTFYLAHRYYSVANIKANIKLILLMTTLVTTGTTTGYILLIFMLMMNYIAHIPKRYRYNKFKFIFAIAAMIIGILLAYQIFLNKESSVSWLTRIDDFKAGLQAWLVSPIFGNGYNESDTIQSFMSSFRVNNLGFSNSVTRILGQGGIVLFSAYMIPVLGSLIRAWHYRNFNLIFFIGVFTLEFIFTIFSYKYLMLIIIAFLYSTLLVEKDKVYAHYENSHSTLSEAQYELNHISFGCISPYQTKNL